MRAAPVKLVALMRANNVKIENSEASLMYRIADLKSQLAELEAQQAELKALREEGCNVLEKTDDSEYGKFGWVIDPEGNKIELWQPPA